MHKKKKVRWKKKRGGAIGFRHIAKTTENEKKKEKYLHKATVKKELQEHTHSNARGKMGVGGGNLLGTQ